MELLLVPLVGPFHLRSPAYNAISVRDLVASWGPDAIATTALVEGELADPTWQDTPEIALPLTLLPWASQRNIPFSCIGEVSPEPDAEEDFRRYLQPFPEARRRLARLDALEERLAALLAEPLTVERIERDLLPALRVHQEARENEFGDGPASDWLRRRMQVCARRLLDIDSGRLAVLAPVEHLPFLTTELEGAGRVPDALPNVPTTPDARERAILDFALRFEVPEPGALIARLRELPGPEARYHEANLLLAAGHGYEALELLEGVSQGDFRRPYFLPGYLLARLGQLRDLALNREGALRAYRGVLALDYSPAEARESARAGLERPFSP